MIKIKQTPRKKLEIILFSCVILFIITNGLLQNDKKSAIISAICGISYTFLAGKGNPFCYIIGLIGSGFYSFLSFQNALWGNLVLYLSYYIPMQIVGFFKWNKNLKSGTYEIKKTSLTKKEFAIIFMITALFIIITTGILYYCKDTHPILDSITTVCSITGMYLTVRRAIEQWIIWMAVNSLSLLMWIYIALSGAKVISTVLMWTVYLLLAIYFYFEWKSEQTKS
jgi:nicotinamide mononucleotide transporter